MSKLTATQPSSKQVKRMAAAPPPPSNGAEAWRVVVQPQQQLDPQAPPEEEAVLPPPSPTTSMSSPLAAPSPPPFAGTDSGNGSSRLRRGLRCLGKWATAGVWRNPPQTAHLDGLRGMACLTVMLWHFLCGFYPGIAFADRGMVPAEAPYNTQLGTSKLLLFFNGPFNVDIFYALSGFVLSYSYLGHGRNAALASAMVRRLPRLLGPFAVVVLLAWQLGRWGWVDQGSQAAQITKSPWLATPTLGSGVGDLNAGNVGAFVLSMFTESHLEAWRRAPRNLWTIRVEFRGSFVVFLLAFLMKALPCQSTPTRWLLYPLIMFWYSIESQGALQSFIYGLLLADLQRNTRLFHTPTRHTMPPLALAARWLLAAAALGWWLYAQATYGHVRKAALPPGDTATIRFNRAAGLGAACALLFLQLVPLARRPLASAPARFVGYISFSLYLLHAEVYSTLTSRLFLHLHPTIGYHPAAWAAFAVSLPVIILFAWAMTLLVDDPTVKYTRALYDAVFEGFDAARPTDRWLRRTWEDGVVRRWRAFEAKGPEKGGWLWWLLCVDAEKEGDAEEGAGTEKEKRVVEMPNVGAAGLQ